MYLQKHLKTSPTINMQIIRILIIARQIVSPEYIRNSTIPDKHFKRDVFIKYVLLHFYFKIIDVVS